MRVGGNLLVQNYPDWDRRHHLVGEQLHAPLGFGQRQSAVLARLR